MSNTGNPNPTDAGGFSHAYATAPAEERRRHARQEILNRQLIPIHLGAENGGLISDLDEGGAAVVSVAPLRLGASTSFSFRLDDSQPEIKGTAIVVWVDGSGLNGGLRFEGMSARAKEILRECLDRIRKEPAPAIPEEREKVRMEPAEGNRAHKTAEEHAVAEESPGISLPVTGRLELLDPLLADKLRRCAERARLLSRAQGACIAVKNEQQFLCEASVGVAPGVGISLNLEWKLAAECVAGSGAVVCEDLRNDSRVDAATRRKLSHGSALLLPMFRNNALFGWLGVFSSDRNAFSKEPIERLRECARMIEKFVLERWPGEPASAPSRATESMANGRLPRAITKTSTAIDRGPLSSGAANPAMRTVVIAVLAGVVLLGGLALWQQYLRNAAPAVSAPRPVASSVVKAPPAEIPPPQAKSEAVAAPASNVKVEANGAVASKPAPADAVPTDHKVEPTAAAPSNIKRETSATVPLKVKPTVAAPKPDVSLKRDVSVKPPVVTPPKQAQSTPVENRPPSVAKPEAAVSKPGAAPAHEAQQVAQRPAETPVAPKIQVAPAPNNPAPVGEVSPQAAAAKPPAPAAPKPHVEVSTALMKPAGTTPLPQPQLVSKADLRYPASAIAEHRQGSVILRVTVQRDGSVETVHVLDGDPGLAEGSVSAVRQWRYQPYRVNGREVPTELLVTINYVLSP